MTTQTDVCKCSPHTDYESMTLREWHNACVIGLAQFLLDCYDGGDKVNSSSFWHLRIHLAGAR